MFVKQGVLVTLLLASSSTIYAADEWSVLIHGATIHSDCKKGKGKKSKTCDFNNFNPGLGLSWAFGGDKDTGKVSLLGGTYKDSHKKMAVYGGMSYRKEWYITSHTFAGLGVQAGYLDGSGARGLAILPMATIGYKSLALEIGYAPNVKFVPGRNHVAVTTFSLRWTL
ncbi:hypothetical protein [Aeromonas cavernicola]|uniref:Outer membrane protein beta-barrel domain-containing protein n=1 Tax=Aeromonas cavernicola TaxID=1006623 RepID=A0A2H9U7V5_9GAMM|nr:hypothetical protein [Aeromonas cavernicola]PJG60126.1 hypothetical protein CUC53_03615 [Aeromonas cavernicola]